MYGWPILMLSQVIYYCRDCWGLTREFFWQWDTPTLLRNGRVNGQINAFRSIKNMQHSRPSSQEAPNLSRALFSLLLLFRVWNVHIWMKFGFSWSSMFVQSEKWNERPDLRRHLQKGVWPFGIINLQKKGVSWLGFYYWHVPNGK